MLKKPEGRDEVPYNLNTNSTEATEYYEDALKLSLFLQLWMESLLLLS